MDACASKTILARYVVTETTEANDPAARQITFRDGTSYFICSKLVEGGTARRDGKPKWVPSAFDAYPIVLMADGAPWDEANLFLYSEVEGKPYPSTSGIVNTAEDLAAYRRFLDAFNLDHRDFPLNKNKKPTYLFTKHLNREVMEGKLAPSTAARRKNSMIRLYRWMMDELKFVPASRPWKERVAYVSTRGVYGQAGTKAVLTTDLQITAKKQDDDSYEYIQDGEKLRPLPDEEQDWLLDALTSLRNTEMTLIHLLALFTGARIQTALTFKVRDVLKLCGVGQEIIYRVGPGTGIDTKGNKKQTLHIPTWFYKKLQTYATSERAKRRRQKAIGGDTEDQYLFLSINGLPMYVSKEDTAYGPVRERKYTPKGQAVRQYMTDYIIPFIRNKYNPSFKYRFHDLRATFGMNLVDYLAPAMNRGEMTYTKVLNYVSARMWHTSPTTTERYLSYRRNLKLHREAQDGWEIKLRKLAESAMGAMDEDI